MTTSARHCTIHVIVSLLVLLAGVTWATAAAPVGHRLIEVSRADGTRFQAWFYYPAVDAGRNTAVQPGDTSYPLIVFAHGFLAPAEVYWGTCAYLAARGYGVIAPRSAFELFPDHFAYAEDILYCLDAVEALNQDGWFDTEKVGLSGHSMGGGASLLAGALADSRVRSIAVLAPAQTWPSSVEAASQLTVPVLYITGSQDAITPASFHADPITAATASTWARLELIGGSHCGFVAAPTPEGFCDEASISRAEQLLRTHRYLAAYFSYTLHGDLDAARAVWGPALLFEQGVRFQRGHAVTMSPRIIWCRDGVLTFTMANPGQVTDRFQIDLDRAPVHTLRLDPGEMVTVRLPVPGGTRRLHLVEILSVSGRTGGTFGIGIVP